LTDKKGTDLSIVLSKNILQNFDRGLASKLIPEEREERNAAVFHASSTGKCIRKTVIEYLIANHIRFDDDGQVVHLMEEHEKNDQFLGIVGTGNYWHQTIEQIAQDTGTNIIAADMISPLSIVENFLKTKTIIPYEHPNDDTIKGMCFVFGKGDLLIGVTDIQLYIFMDLKTISQNKAKIYADKAEMIEGLRWVPPERMEAMQVTMYYLGASDILKNIQRTANLHYVICHLDKGTNIRYYSIVQVEDWMLGVSNYWNEVALALNRMTDSGILPPYSPQESWECRWGRKRKDSCYLYQYCEDRKRRG